MTGSDILARITHDPAVMGRPCLRGMRVTVCTIVGLLGADHSVDDILLALQGDRAPAQSIMKLVVDVSLPPKWVEFLAARGIGVRTRDEV